MEDFDFDDDVAEARPAATFDVESIEVAVAAILKAIGEDGTREGLSLTPRRVARMYGELLSGYDADLDRIVNNALFHIK